MYDVYAVFKGYSGTIGGMKEKYVSDEWLAGLYRTEASAKEAVREFGEGRAFDNPDENQITRFYERGRTIFENGVETLTEVAGGNRRWMRYAKMTVDD